jgi:hypothetical protein
VKPDENNGIYIVSARPTTDPAGISSPEPTKKHTSEPTLQISYPKPRKKTSRLIKIDSQMEPQINQKSMKIQPWTPRCPLRCPCGPMDDQHGHPRAKIKPPRYQNGASRSPKLQFLTKLIIHVTNQLVNSYLLTGGRRQGRSLKIFRDYFKSMST